MFEEEKNNLEETTTGADNGANTQDNNEYRYTKDNIIDNQYNNGNMAGQNNAYQNNSYQNNSYQNNSYQNANYQNMNYQNMNYKNSVPPNNYYQQQAKPKKEKKKSGFGKKLLAIAASAVLFGAIAGSTMYGVYYTGMKYGPKVEGASASVIDLPTVSSEISTSNIVSDSTEGVTSKMDVSAVAKAAMPAMVALQGTTTVSSGYGSFGQNYEAATSGTGIIVGKNDTELLILTNAHVIDGVNNLECLFVDGEKVTATVKGSKSDKDIAVVAVTLSSIKTSTLESIAIAELGASEDVVVGQEVVAIGNALGEGQSVTNGIISALNREITVDNITFSGLFMTNAAINSGNSGGALINSDGKVVGINFAKTSEDGVEGMAYSIPVSNVKELIDSLMNRQTRTKVADSEASYLGISGVDITSTMSKYYGYPQGLQIRSVVNDSAASKAGLTKYDIIVSFDDQTVSSMSSLQSIMQYYKAGETVEVEYYHIEGSEYVLKTASVTLDAKNK